MNGICEKSERNSIKIAFVIGQLGDGGAERVAVNLCDFFVSKGHNVTFYITSHYIGEIYNLNPLIAVKTLSSSEGRNPLLKIRELGCLFKNDRPDVVIGFNATPGFYAAKAASYASVPVVTSERNSPRDYDRGFLISRFKKWSFYHSDAIVFQTKGAMNCYEERIRDKGIVIPNFIGSHFGQIERCASSIEAHEILMLGRLAPQKNYPLAIEAFRVFSSSHPGFELNIYGQGDKKYVNYLRALVAKRGLSNSVRFCGYASDTEKLLRKTGIFLLTSLYEGMSNSLMEALALGVPCISTDSRPGGSKEMLDGLRGSLLCDNDDPQALAEALGNMAEGYEAYFAEAKNDSRIVVERYSAKSIGQRWLDLLSHITTTFKSRSE